MNVPEAGPLFLLPLCTCCTSTINSKEAVITTACDGGNSCKSNSKIIGCDNNIVSHHHQQIKQHTRNKKIKSKLHHPRHCSRSNKLNNIITSSCCSSSYSKLAMTFTVLLSMSSSPSSINVVNVLNVVNAEHFMAFTSPVPPFVFQSYHDKFKHHTATHSHYHFHNGHDKKQFIYAATKRHYQNTPFQNQTQSIVDNSYNDSYHGNDNFNHNLHSLNLNNNSNNNNNNSIKKKKNECISTSSTSSTPTMTITNNSNVEKMKSSIKNALSRKLNEYEKYNNETTTTSTFISSQSSRKYAISPRPPPLSSSKMNKLNNKSNEYRIMNNEFSYKYHSDRIKNRNPTINSSSSSSLDSSNNVGNTVQQPKSKVTMFLNKQQHKNITPTCTSSTSSSPPPTATSIITPITATAATTNPTNMSKRINQLWKTKQNNNSNNNNNHNIQEEQTRNQQQESYMSIRTKKRQITKTIRNFWKKRNARSIEEGIRRGRSDNYFNDNNNINTSNGNYKHNTNGQQRLYNLLMDDKDDYDTNKQHAIKKITMTSNSNNNNNSNDRNNKKKQKKKRYIARTISGLISALAEEATGVDVNVELKDDTPIWEKHVDKLSIQFERLGIKQLKMGGLDEALQEISNELPPIVSAVGGDGDGDFDEVNTNDNDPNSLLFTNAIQDMNNMIVTDDNYNDGNSFSNNNNITSMDTPDEIFDKIDVDNSGTLDAEELTRALFIASGVIKPNEKSMGALERLAERLIRLYDTNGDGVVDRDEYKKLVTDMTAVRNAQRMKQKEREKRQLQQSNEKRFGWFTPLKWGRAVLGIKSESEKNVVSDEESFNGFQNEVSREEITLMNQASNTNKTTNDLVTNEGRYEFGDGGKLSFQNAEDISNDLKVLNAMTKGEGSIVLEDLKLDLRRLVFGAFPVVKKITPGGPLILEPFTMTVTASFNRDDILDSALLDDGLRRLVARALRRRVRSVRDLLDGAVFYGRTWNMASKEAPVVEVPKLTNIEFDKKDRLIITGRAKVRASPDQPFVENSFKLRTKLGSRENGQYIRLEEPELALMIECPKYIEKNIVALCKTLKLPIPTRPDPIEQYFPLVSPIKKTEDDGFNLGEDNRIKSIFIKDNALRFEISAVLRPGRFLGNHYLAFTVPNRTFIITMDRIREGIRNARQNKRNLRRLENKKIIMVKKEKSERYRKAFAQALSRSNKDFGSDIDLSYRKDLGEDEQFTFLEPEPEKSKNPVGDEVLPNRPGFFGRFLEGYLEESFEKERNERLTTAISEFFSSDEETKRFTVIDSNGKPKQRGIV